MSGGSRGWVGGWMDGGDVADGTKRSQDGVGKLGFSACVMQKRLGRAGG